MIREHSNYSLRDHNTFAMNVKCNKFIEFDSVEDLPRLAQTLRDQKHWMSIGEGSNLLFTKDYDGAIVHCAMDGLRKIDETDSEVILHCEAGWPLDHLVNLTTEEGLWGLENLSGIPGDVGAAAVQNVGAYGVEARDVIHKVYAYNIDDDAFEVFDPEDCGFDYRESIFKHPESKNLVIVGVQFRLSKTPKPRLDYPALKEAISNTQTLTPAEVRETVIEIRNAKLPDPAEVPSAGSFFRNPIISKAEFQKFEGNPPHYDLADGLVKMPAAWLIDQCGWKGKSLGNASVWHLQPLVLTNPEGKAEPKEIIALKDAIIESVKDKYGLTLEPEVQIV